jgi:hypothetical protein
MALKVQCENNYSDSDSECLNDKCHVLGWEGYVARLYLKSMSRPTQESPSISMKEDRQTGDIDKKKETEKHSRKRINRN